jgi:hypothetical protein
MINGMQLEGIEIDYRIFQSTQFCIRHLYVLLFDRLFLGAITRLAFIISYYSRMDQQCIGLRAYAISLTMLISLTYAVTSSYKTFAILRFGLVCK